MKTNIKSIESAIDSEHWEQARKLIKADLKTDPNNHWLLTRLAATYYEQRKYGTALRISKRAVQLMPNCPLVLWDLAGAFEMCGEETKAILIWKDLLKLGESDVAYNECGEGLRWARSLLNDCRYRIAIVLADRRRNKDAIQWLDEHIKHRRPGLPSIYPLRQVKESRREFESRL